MKPHFNNHLHPNYLTVPKHSSNPPLSQEDNSPSFINNSIEPLRATTNDDSSIINFQSALSAGLPKSSFLDRNDKRNQQKFGLYKSISRPENEDVPEPLENPFMVSQYDSSTVLGRSSMDNTTDLLFKRKSSSNPYGFNDMSNIQRQETYETLSNGPTSNRWDPTKNIQFDQFKKSFKGNWQQFEEEENKEYPSGHKTRQVGTIHIRSKLGNPISLENEDLENQNSPVLNSSRKPNIHLLQPGSQNDDLAQTTQGASSRQIVSNQQPPAPQILPARPSADKMEMEVFLKERIALTGALMFSSVFLWLMLQKNFSGHYVLMPIYLYFGFLALQRAHIAFKIKNLDNWYKNESKLELLSAICSLLTLLIIHLKLSDMISHSLYAVIPGVISTMAYAVKSVALDNDKKVGILVMVVYTLQVLCLALKLDIFKHLEWVFALMISLMYLGSIASLFIIYGGLLVLTWYIISRKNFRDPILTNKALYVGISWNFLYYGLAGVLGFIVVGIVNAFDPHGGLGLLKGGAIFSGAFNFVLMVYTFRMRKMLAIFRIYFDPDRLIGINTPAPQTPAPKAVIGFETQQKNTYFINLSSTYFLPLTRDFLAKSKANIERIKGVFKETKLGKTLTKSQPNKDNNTKPKIVNKETLQKYKETLDGKLENALKARAEKPKTDNNATNLQKFLRLFSPRIQGGGVMLTSVAEASYEKPDKLCMSVGNIDDLENVYSKPKTKMNTQVEDELLCYLCYASPPNCVLMTCGHGGFCYDCALSAVKAKNECMECRSKVEEIHKIDPELKLAGIVKTIEISKVVITTAPVKKEMQVA